MAVKTLHVYCIFLKKEMSEQNHVLLHCKMSLTYSSWWPKALRLKWLMTILSYRIPQTPFMPYFIFYLCVCCASFPSSAVIHLGEISSLFYYYSFIILDISFGTCANRHLSWNSREAKLQFLTAVQPKDGSHGSEFWGMRKTKHNSWGSEMNFIFPTHADT